MADEVIARSAELLAIATSVAAVPDGGHAMLLAGDAGIGKTALWQAGLRLATERGVRVLTSRSSPSETQLAFATIGDLFTPVVDETVAALHPVQRRALECALLIRESDGAAPEARALGLALVSVLKALTADGPVLLAIDDAQWVDGSSADVLRFVLRRLGSLPVGVLATVRGQPVEAPFELERSFAQFRRLSVGPLSLGAIHSLLWDRLALALPRPVLVRVHTATGGNPFFALELGRGIDDGSISADADEMSLPHSLLAVVHQRLAALPAPLAQTLVATAALAAPTVILMAPLGGTTVDDLELAQERGVLEFDGDRIRFTHPLLTPACYALLPPHRRRQVHRRLADLDIDPEEKARHLALATTGVDEEIASALDAAVARARGRGAVQAAAELAERAVALTPGEALDDIARRRITAARLCLDAGDLAKARTLLEGVVASTAPGRLRAEALGWLAEVRGRAEGNPIATELLLRALAEPGVDDGQRATIFGSLAWNMSVSGDSRAAMGYAESALALAETFGEPAVLVHSLTRLAEITFWRDGRIRRDLLDRAIEIHLSTHGAPNNDPRATLAHQLGRANHFEESRQLYEELIAEAQAREDPEVVTLMFFLARMEVGSGHWDRVGQLCRESMELARQTGRKTVDPLCRMILAEIDAYRGVVEPAVALDLVREAQSLGYGGATHRLSRALASFELARNDPHAAWGQLEPRFEGIQQMDEVVAQLAGSVAVEALVAIGDLTSAELLLSMLDESAQEADTGLDSFAHRCHGLLLEARGDLPAAIAELEAATVLPKPPAGRNPFEQARTLLLLGRVHREAQHKRAARETLEQALGIFEQLGARPWADRTRSEIRRIGGRRSTRGQLSETEQRIVELVVAGRKNREVADELFLSSDTVAWNLSRVYKKLGVTSRTQLAARLAHDNDPKAAR
jgi:DNA-binding CsgD family transcriptional regulator